MSAPLLIEVGCEEIPARFISSAAAELAVRVSDLLDQAALGHGPAVAWGASRRLAVRVEDVEERQADRFEQILGPPASVAFGADGAPSRAAVGFARKQGVDPSSLIRVQTERGEYAGLRRSVAGRSTGDLLRGGFAQIVEAVHFPKTMRWGDGAARWVRPVHWLLALHGEDVLPLELFGARARAVSRGHRFLAPGEVVVGHADRYREALRSAHVIVDPSERRETMARELRRAATEAGGRLREDPELLEEVADLLEWPGVVLGRFDDAFLGLPVELLVTTLRHHQKCFSVESDGELLPAFLAVSNMPEDPAGHVRRGNEWVVRGRLDDARFFWGEDRKSPLADRSARLANVTFHANCGTYAEKSERIAALAGTLAERAGLGEREVEAARQAARVAKNDLVTGTVGEFPELQGVVGGLMLREEGAAKTVHRAVYEHYRPSGADDPIPETSVGCVVSAADKLDSVAWLVAAGEAPTGSRDPLGLRRASNGVFRIVLERQWPLSLRELTLLAAPADGRASVEAFLRERLQSFLRERGYTTNEVQAVLEAGSGRHEAGGWSLSDIASRIEALRGIRQREDFARLVELTKRVDNIRTKGGSVAEAALAHEADVAAAGDPAVEALEHLLARIEPEIGARSASGAYTDVLDLLSGFVEPVDRFFERVLVLDSEDPGATRYRLELLGRLHRVLTQYFDLRELPGQADGRT